MLDIHPPEHGIHGFRDFFLHLLTITVGLFIALLLEAGVEGIHHRHQRKEAEATIRQEIQDNRAKLVKAQQIMQNEQKSMLGVLNFLEERSQGRPGNPEGLNLSFSEGPLQDAAWRTASSTGVMNYMEYGEVERFSAAYKEQAQFETMEQQTLDEYLELDSFVVKGFDPRNVSMDDIKAAQPIVRRALAHLEGMIDISRGTIQQYDSSLK